MGYETSQTMTELQTLYEDYDKKFKAHCKLHWKLMCRFGVHHNPKLKKLPAHEVVGSKLDLQEREAKVDLDQARNCYLSALRKEQGKWTVWYWFMYHPWQRKDSSTWAKQKVSEVRSMLNNHTNLSCVFRTMGGNVNSHLNRYVTVKHFRLKGFDCDCDYCAINVHLGNKLYDRFYQGTPKNDACNFLAVKGE